MSYFVIDAISTILVVQSDAPLFTHDANRMLSARGLITSGPFSKAEAQAEATRLRAHYIALTEQAVIPIIIGG